MSESNNTSGSSHTEDVSQLALETSLFINSSNPTIVGLWDLQHPSQSEKSKATLTRLRLHNLESLGPEGDRRKRANDGNIKPPGQYKAICKLFMTYVDGPPDEYIGTGWLISNDIIVTAGHCLYDWKYRGGFLKHIRCYFGYAGAQSPGTYRYGVTAAIPAEYLKAESVVHDVSFVRLNEPVEGVPVFTYSNTPSVEIAELGVVGYPGDLDFGEQLYEHWAKVNTNLAKTGTLLSYKIDTAPGQSGAPVLRKLPDGKVDAIGVHVTGGFPNVGSVIGPIGNRFEEYILAMNVKGGYVTSSATTAFSPKKLPVPGFQMISIKPTPAGSGRERGHQSSPSFSGITNPEAMDALKLQETALGNLFGTVPSVDPEKQPTKPSGSVAKGTLTKFPETLRLESDPLPAVDFDKAVDKAKEQNDLQTVFFVNFTAPLEGDALKQQQDLMDSIQTWQAWASTNCEGKVQQQVDAKKLPDDAKGQFARSAYRAKVFDYLFRSATWFAKTFDQNMSKHIEVKKVDFHPEILTSVLEGFSIPTSVYSNLEKILNQISSGIKASSETNSEAQQYWIMMTKYEYQPLVKRVQPYIRVIQFQVDQQARTYSSNKASYQSVSFDFNFGQYQADFNNRIFSQIQAKIDKKLVEQGEELLQKSILDVTIDV